jgi:hypothetical protein
MRPYTRENILSINLGQNGIYGIFHNTTAVYIGSGDMQEYLLAHLGGDNPCITRNNPNLWTGEVFPVDSKMREGELIREYQPICNQVILRHDHE